MTPEEEALLTAAVGELIKIGPEIAEAVETVIKNAANRQPLSPALLHLEIVAAAKALGLDPSKV
jgi:hypothetical protein